ncbi:uncharacterized protein LY89DRAFT_723115 [Mollisia scopiformis]|uniref:Exonuclease domain-containing protein n=1 Tax=Mollisia scopiformis TaxID=149040 RepID=A0A194WTL2_MOLSC|nr:uncharacterized protein LY89DRAFT_723115 [Mollisia scopiformis]KUJ11296.1 hypothetical protein LY89DRAFT_723115 [Mollisia scopiformis]
MATTDIEVPDVGSQLSDSGSSGKKRKHEEEEEDIAKQIGMDQTPSLPQQPELPEFNLTSASRSSQDKESPRENDRASSPGWQTVERPRKKTKRVPKAESKNYPAIGFSHDARLQTYVKLNDLQSLVLYILADGPSPQFVSVRHRPQIRKVVVLMVPGLEMDMFYKQRQDNREMEDSRRDRDRRDRNYEPDDIYPKRLRPEKLSTSLQPWADMFEHIWPVKTPGDDKFGRMHSPFHTMLTAPAPKTKEEKDWKKNRKGVAPAKEPQGWKNTRVPIPEFIHPTEVLLENEYTLHPAIYADEDDKAALAEHRQSNGVSEDHGWVDTIVKSFEDGTAPEEEIESGSITAGREVLAMDCEMCMTGETEFSLTRISLVSWDGTVVLDELVKPAKPITNYLTQYSGITEQMLEPVTTTLQDIQKRLLEILHPRTVLLGHSLNSDLNAIKITHPYIIDTAVIYPHPRGPPLKSSLKWLAQKYLNREVQKGHGTVGAGAGHDSVEDARTVLDLVKQKCEKGKDWGTNEAQGENIFKRVARAGVKYKSQGGSAIPDPTSGKSSAMIDWGEPKKGPGAAANFPIGCTSDEEIMDGVIRAVKGDADGKEIPGGGVDFVWARFRELEALKGWWNNNKAIAAEAAAKDAAVEANGDVEMSSVSKGKEFPDSTEPAGVIPSNSLPVPEQLAASKSVSDAAADLTNRITKIYESLPPCTAFIVYSGSGDPREMSRLQAMNATFKREFKIKKWDKLSVKWTDTEEQALRQAVKVARSGVGFICVK